MITPDGARIAFLSDMKVACDNDLPGTGPSQSFRQKEKAQILKTLHGTIRTQNWLQSSRSADLLQLFTQYAKSKHFSVWAPAYNEATEINRGFEKGAMQTMREDMKRQGFFQR